MRCILLFPLALSKAHRVAAAPKGIRKQKAIEALSKTHWLGHASFRIDAEGTVIYIDPWQIPDGPKADLILVTHDHHDHCSPKDVAKISKDDTAIVTVPAAAAKLPGSATTVKPGDDLTVKGIGISAVPAYNTNKFRSPGIAFHPREKAYVGFVIHADGQRIYHAGDTDCISEMKEIDADITLLPVSGTYVMTVEEAVEAVKQKVPDVVHVLPFEK